MNDMPLFNYNSLELAREKFWRNLNDGGTCDCPVCGRFSHFNRFKICRTMVRNMATLARLQTESNTGYVHHTAFLAGEPRGFYDLKRWDMIEAAAKGDGDEAKRTSGMWRVTPKGFEFMRGELRVPKYMFVFDDKVCGHSEETLSVHDAWGEYFFYPEVLEGHLDRGAGA